MSFKHGFSTIESDIQGNNEIKLACFEVKIKYLPLVSKITNHPLIPLITTTHWRTQV